MLRSLLVPLDGTQAAETVLPTVSLLAQRAGARVTLLHLVERRAPATIHGDRHLTTAAEAEAYLREIAAKHFPPGVTVGWHVHGQEITDVAHSVADHADELQADLVVMFVHGRENLRHRLFGPLAQHVVRQAPAPILLLQPNAAGQIPVPFRQLLLPLDGREEHEAGLGAAQEMAILCAAAVHLLMVVPTRSTLGGPDAATGQLLPAATHEMLELAQQEAVQYLERHLQPFIMASVSATATVARGEPATIIREEAGRQKADLVVLGTHGQSGWEAFWSGSLGSKLLGSIPASFLLAPAKGK
jgi:nucleotide-binding universal stress UspA family protein